MSSELERHTKRLREACSDRCAEVGDPPCYRLDCWDGKDWCVDCREDAGEDTGDDPIPLDPDAVVRPLL